MDVAREIHARKIRAKRKVTKTRTLSTVRRRSKVVHGLQTRAVSELRDASHVTEELHDNTGEERGLHDPNWEPCSTWDDVQISIWTTVDGERWPWRKGLTRRFPVASVTKRERETWTRQGNRKQIRWSTIKRGASRKLRRNQLNRGFWSIYINIYIYIFSSLLDKAL